MEFPKLRTYLLFLYLIQVYYCEVIEKPKCEKYSVTTSSGNQALPGPYCPGDVIFEDTFDTLDHDNWEHENTLSGNGNWEFQWYTNNRSNSFVRNGNLYIRPSLLSDQFGDEFVTSGTLNIHGGAPADQCTNAAWFGCERIGTPQNILNPIKSAKIRTINSFKFRYGKLEARAKMPVGDWLWGAIYLMPAKNAYGSWPSSGEIDLVESRGNKGLVEDSVNIGVQQAASTLHFGPFGSLNGWERAHFKLQNSNGFHNGFHLYQLEWTPEYIKFSIDNKPIGIINPTISGFWGHGGFANRAPGIDNPWREGSKMAPFDQEFYLIMNLAVGGTSYFPENATNPDPKPWKNNSPTAMKDFYEQRAKWLRTWNLDVGAGTSSSLQVDYIKVTAL